ncbi:tetrahydrofolate dehydrogenase/cyclohydrolase catalytic domain-containing protein, partial [Acinetobacter baumannii]
EEIGFRSTLIRFPDDISEQELLIAVDSLNNNKDIDGILVQLPLPKHISEQKLIEAIDPTKDVDGFHPSSVGKLVQGLPTFIPA